MEDLVRSLSEESTDEIRRKRLEDLFQDENFEPNFLGLFDACLIDLGDRVKALAAEEAENANQNGSVSPKTDLQLQLWALVDMMVQSKILIKRANGKWGSEGSFG